MCDYPRIMATLPFSENKILRLADCATLSMGYSFRGRIETSPEGPICLIQMRDLTSDNFVDARAAARIQDTGFGGHHYVSPGDLVFRARGMNNTAALAAEIPERAALDSPLVRIRPRVEIVEPRYLQWFINLPASQTFLATGLQGSLVRMVSVEHLAGLKVIVPPLPTQRLIGEVVALYEREAALLRRIAELRQSQGRSLLVQKLFGIDGRIYGE